MIYPDGTIELAPEKARWFYWRFAWFVWRWLLGGPHLQTMNDDGTILFRRWWLFGFGAQVDGWPGISIYYHKYGDKPSPDFSAHRHPRNVWRAILKGGYYEEVVIKALGTTERFTRWIGTSLFGHNLSRDHYHRVEKMIPGTKTIFVMWGRWRGWEFLNPEETKGSSRILKEQT